MDTIELLLSRIEQALAERGYGQQQPEGLYAPIEYTLALGGKRVRPLLCLMGAQLFSDDVADALPIAVGLEVFHNFTLLHDDLMDRSPLRRGKPTVYRAWDENTAILSGDAMSIEAYRCLDGIRRPQLLAEVLPRFSRVAIEVCVGQRYDMEYEQTEEVSVCEYIEMIRLKTAVLLGASLALGAMAAGADSEDIRRLDEAGQALGLAFQIQDDYLDVYGDEATFGKPIGGDIANGKKTLMLLYTQQMLTGALRQELNRLMGLPDECRDERISGVRHLYDQAGTPAYARERIAYYTSVALERLSSLSVPPQRTEGLRQLFERLMNRIS